MKQIVFFIAIIWCASVIAQDKCLSRHLLCAVDTLLSLKGQLVSYSEKSEYAEIDVLNGWSCRDEYYEKTYLRSRQDFVNNFITDVKLYSLGTP